MQREEKIGFIGLGSMGMPMAKNLLKAGYSLGVYDINRSACAQAGEAGAKVYPDTATLAQEKDIIITILPADRQIREVYMGANGLMDMAREGTLFIEMTSAMGETVCQLEQEALSRGKKLRFVDAPVSGGVAGATAGTLTIMVGGAPEDVEAARPILEVLGEHIIPTGSLGSGKNVKIINQLLNAIHTCAAAEAIYLARTMNLDLQQLLPILYQSTGDSWVLRNNVPKFMLTGEYTGGFKLSLMRKDVGLALRQASQSGLKLPVSQMVDEIFETALQQGNGDENYNVISRFIENQNKSASFLSRARKKMEQ